LSELDQKARAMGINLEVERYGESGKTTGSMAPESSG
jgi:hypothetical protein